MLKARSGAYFKVREHSGFQQQRRDSGFFSSHYVILRRSSPKRQRWNEGDIIRSAADQAPEYFFHNTSQEIFSFQEMYERILQFMRDDPTASYRIAIGTDSQVRSKTYFVTAVLIHRVGKGAVGFLREVVIPRNIKSLREKISLETAYTLEIAYLFTPQHLTGIYDSVGKRGRNNHLNLEIHLDIGKAGPTKDLIKEMVNRVSGLGFDVKIKPFASAASSLANRYTK